MGKPYWSELKQVPDTLDWALHQDVSKLGRTLVHELGRHNLIAIGSGGSLVAATYAALLHEDATGRLARTSTPLEAVTRMPQRNAAALLLSARGSNSDIRRVAEALPRLGYEAVAGLSMRRGSPLRRILAPFGGTVHEFDLPSGRDGFLATNSLIASLVLMHRAVLFCNPRLNRRQAPLELSPSLEIGAESALQHRTIVVLAYGWAAPAALDFESRCAEAGIANVWVTDPRNFAHGRHHWLSVHPVDTGIVTFETAEGEAEVSRALRYLPEETSVLRIRSSLEGAASTIDLVWASMQLAGHAARARGIDPGKPSVPTFGRRLFRAGMRNHHTPFELSPITKKRRALFLGPQADVNALEKSLSRFSLLLDSTVFSGLVIDYDGTLCSQQTFDSEVELGIWHELNRLLDGGLLLGIASGRGDSVYHHLRRVVLPEYWSQVLVGLYNGAVYCELSEDIPILRTQPLCSLTAAQERLTPLEAMLGFRMVAGPYQISLRDLTVLDAYSLRQIALEHIAEIRGIDALASSHSVDIVPSGTSKVAVVGVLDEKRPGAVLRIGDQGAAGGNDFELLNSGISLSVDKVSSNLQTCWNLGGYGLSGPRLTNMYLHAMHMKAGNMRFSSSQLVTPYSGLRHESRSR